MSILRKCPTCKEHKLFSHRCKPEWLVLNEEWHGTLTEWDEATKIRAFSHEEAAIEFTKFYDGDDFGYAVANGGSILVRVKPGFETAHNVKEFTVRGGWEPAYSVEETKPQPTAGNFFVTTDSLIPRNEIHMKDHTGRVISRIVGLGEPVSC